MNADEFAKHESAEREFLRAVVGGLRGEVALRKVLNEIITLPRHEVFGTVVIQSGSLRRVITGERENPSAAMNGGVHLYLVRYGQGDVGRRLTRPVLAKSAEEAVTKAQRILKMEGEKYDPAKFEANVVHRELPGFQPIPGAAA